jgi:hypothetical protein
VLRLGNNKLTGSLEAFAAALNDPAAVAAAKDAAPAGSSSSSAKGLSRLFDLNVTANQLTGPVPQQLAYLGVFNPNITILVPGSDGAAAIAPRVLDLSNNQLAGPGPPRPHRAVGGGGGSWGFDVKSLQTHIDIGCLNMCLAVHIRSLCNDIRLSACTKHTHIVWSSCLTLLPSSFMCLPYCSTPPSQVPSTVGSCGCSVAVSVSGPRMRLPCPPEGSSLAVTDFMWQTAAEQRYTCWAEGGAAAAGGKATAGHQAQLLDYLASPSNNFDAVDTAAMALGDGGGQIADQQQQAAKKRGAIAGAVVGVVVGGALLAVVGYFVVYRRLLQPAKATAFRKFEDDAAAAAAAGLAAGGVIDMQGLPSGGAAAAAAAAAAGPAVSAAEAAARPM